MHRESTHGADRGRGLVPTSGAGVPLGPQSYSGKLCSPGPLGLLVADPSHPISSCLSASLAGLNISSGQGLEFVLVHALPGTELMLQKCLFTE